MNNNRITNPNNNIVRDYKSRTTENMGGQIIIKSEKIKTKSEKINLSSLPKGVYVIKVITDKNSYTRKVIKT